MKTPARAGFAIFVVVSICLAGCTGGPADEDSNTMVDPAWTSYMLHPTAMMLEDVRPFTVIDGVTNLSTNLTWGVFDATKGGNCCEHYLATTEWGWLLNFGGEYPMWSEDRGATWSTYLPSTFTDVQCRTPKPTISGQEGLGEGSIVQTTTGDIISMGWFPYPSNSGGDQFYAFLWDGEEQAWTWCFNRLTEPFYDRSWQVEIVGPITSPLGNGAWGSLVISNFWHQSTNRGGQMSVDGLNYYHFPFPDRDADLDVMSVDLNVSNLPAVWDVNKPHKEMRAFPVPSGGAYFPDYFDDGGDAYLDTNLEWWRATTANGSSLPSEYCALDSSGALSCVSAAGTSLIHQRSTDGGETWANRTYDLSDVASGLEEWEFHGNGAHDLFVLNARYQSVDGPDVDVAWHVRDVSMSMEPDTLTYLGLGDLDSTSGAGADIRFDFASMGILPDGGAVIAYHDTTDIDPLFAVELHAPQF